MIHKVKEKINNKEKRKNGLRARCDYYCIGRARFESNFVLYWPGKVEVRYNEEKRVGALT